MKIFISHQRDDSLLASKVAHRLTTHGIATYLDVIDPIATSTGDNLGDYIRDVLGKCDQLLAVVSEKTKMSWWVPWEIGISTEKDQPIATYAGDATTLPEYLRKWPYLRSFAELDAYAQVSKIAASQVASRRGTWEEASVRKSSTRAFYRDLRAQLGQ